MYTTHTSSLSGLFSRQENLNFPQDVDSYRSVNTLGVIFPKNIPGVSKLVYVGIPSNILPLPIALNMACKGWFGY